jgi:hypothetical protein
MEFVEMRRACASALNLVRQACPNLKIAEDYTPTFTLLIVQKRHRKIKIRPEFFYFLFNFRHSFLGQRKHKQGGKVSCVRSEEF